MVDGVSEPPGLVQPPADTPHTPTPDEAPAAAGGKRRPTRLSLGSKAWALLEGGRDPYVILITIYIFGPYFADVVVGDPVKGQALIAKIAVTYGLFAAITAPFLGALVDRYGPRKPWLAVITCLAMPCIAALWWAKPTGGLGVVAVSALLAGCGVLVAWSQLVHNAMLTYASPPAERAHASGLALASGNAVSVLMLAFVLWAFALPGKVDLPFVPAHPLFGLDPASHETDRIVAPITAAAFGLLALPLFFLCKDAPRRPPGQPAATSELWTALKGLRRRPDLGRYLISQMLFTDGLTAILFFTGVYAGGVMHWRLMDLLAFGMVLSCCSALGGVLSGWMDGWIGTKRTLIVQLVSAICLQLLMLGMSPTRILYLIPYDPATTAPLWSGPVFRTLPEVIFLGIGMLSAVAVTGCYASSRMQLVRLAPVSRIGVYFGLFALSSTVTTWLGSLLVGVATSAAGTQQAGMLPITLLLGAGLLMLLTVKTPTEPPLD